MNRFTSVFMVVLFSLACAGSGHSDLAQEECTPAADASACEKCFIEKCSEQCMNCVDDPVCYACGEGDGLDATCTDNEQIALFLTCVLTADCQTECAGEPPPTKPPRVGRGRKGGGGRGGGGGGGGGGGAGDGEGKAGKGGKHKSP